MTRFPAHTGTEATSRAEFAHWGVVYRSDLVTVTYIEDTRTDPGYACPIYCVAVPGKPVKRFRGESAWMDAGRYAYDHDRAALGCTS